MKEEHKKRILDLKDRVEPSPDLVIKRVPKTELRWFKQWAKDEFEYDYGMALKWLCQSFMPPQETVLLSEIEELNKRIERLEQLAVQPKKEEKVITMGNGRQIRRG